MCSEIIRKENEKTVYAINLKGMQLINLNNKVLSI